MLMAFINKNRSDEVLGDNFRERFWNHVFATWTTRQWPMKPPMEIGKRSGQDWLVHVGTAKEDLVPDEKTTGGCKTVIQ